MHKICEYIDTWGVWSFLSFGKFSDWVSVVRSGWRPAAARSAVHISGRTSSCRNRIRQQRNHLLQTLVLLSIFRANMYTLMMYCFAIWTISLKQRYGFDFVLFVVVLWSVPSFLLSLSILSCILLPLVRPNCFQWYHTRTRTFNILFMTIFERLVFSVLKCNGFF